MALLDQFSILWVYIGTVVLVMVAAEIGFQVGNWLQRRDPEFGQSFVDWTSGRRYVGFDGVFIGILYQYCDWPA